MIRLVLLLCAGMYFALVTLGEDRGQKRYGLMLADQQVALPAAETADVVTDQAVFIPAQTVMAAPAAEPAAAAPAPQTAAETLPEPDVAGGLLFTVAANGANVREGPGTVFAVLGSLGQGEQVLVLAEETPIEGWSRVRLEGDGIEGYIATRLLSQ
jgi:hypothetical protein